MSRWDQISSWTSDGEWYVHKGGGFVPYLGTITGRLSFTVRLVKGKRLQWAVNRTNDRNYILFRIDKKVFERFEVRDGKSTLGMRVLHNLEGDQEYTFRIEILPDHLEHSVKRKDEWSIIDNFVQPGRQFDKGQFGLFIPGRDEFALRSFLLESPAQSR